MMHSRDLHTASCDGKTSYRTWSEADRVMRYVIRTSNEGNQKMTVYRCRFCHDYHFGHDYKK